jgi:type I restriction enzyme S subunit
MKASATDDQIRDYQLRFGDSVITKDSETPEEMGISAYVSESIDGLLAGYHLAIVRPGKNVEPRWLTWALRTGSSREQFSLNSRGLTRVSLGKNAMRSITIPVPSVQEQGFIAAHLDDQTQKIDNLVSLSKQAIELLKKRRQALITQVVTGKLDVRGLSDGDS